MATFITFIRIFTTRIVFVALLLLCLTWEFYERAASHPLAHLPTPAPAHLQCVFKCFVQSDKAASKQQTNIKYAQSIEINLKL